MAASAEEKKLAIFNNDIRRASKWREATKLNLAKMKAGAGVINN